MTVSRDSHILSLLFLFLFGYSLYGFPLVLFPESISRDIWFGASTVLLMFFCSVCVCASMWNYFSIRLFAWTIASTPHCVSRQFPINRTHFPLGLEHKKGGSTQYKNMEKSFHHQGLFLASFSTPCAPSSGYHIADNRLRVSLFSWQ